MRKNTSLYMGIFLLIASFSLMSVSNISNISPDQLSVKQEYFVWNVTGYYRKGEMMIVDIRAHREWGRFLAGGRTVAINVTITGPDATRIDFVCYFYVYQGSPLSITPVLSLLNATASVGAGGSSSESSLSVEKVQDYIGGVVKKEGNFTVIVDEKSIFNNFGSEDPPARIWLLKQEVSYPYMFLLPVGVTLTVLGVVLTSYELYKRKRKLFRKR
ncbi:MAG: hypothetical protein QXL57_00960 [Candidatus Bathyarchaeia archaeon]